MWYGSATNLRKLSPGSMLIPIGPDTLQPTNQVRDLGVYFDSELNMKAHIRRITGACYYHLRLLRALRGLLGQEVTARRPSCFCIRPVTTWLLQCNSNRAACVYFGAVAACYACRCSSRMRSEAIWPHFRINPYSSLASNKAEDWLQGMSPRASNHQWKSSTLPPGSDHAIRFSSPAFNTSFCQSSWSCPAVVASKTWRSCIFGGWSSYLEISPNWTKNYHWHFRF